MTKVLSPSVVGAVAATATAETDVSPTGDALLILTLEKRLQSLMDEIVADHHVQGNRLQRARAAEFTRKVRSYFSATISL